MTKKAPKHVVAMSLSLLIVGTGFVRVFAECGLFPEPCQALETASRVFLADVIEASDGVERVNATEARQAP